MNVYIYDKEQGLPPDDICYIIGKGGAYLKKKLDLIESLTPVDRISFLDEVDTYAKINIPKIPVNLMANIIGFFRKVYELHKSESIVLLYYNKKEKTYKLYVPEQEVTAAGLDYKTDKTIQNHILVGTVHSHASMSAFHSGIDDRDERRFDGLHITIGKVNDPEFFDISVSIVVNGMRQRMTADSYVEKVEEREFTPYFPQMFRPAFDLNDNGEKVYKKDVKTTIMFTLNTKKENFNFDNQWLDKVKERKYEYVTVNYPTQFSGKKYIVKDGKLVEAPPEESYPQQSFNFDMRKFLRDVDKDSGIDNDCNCMYCVHRNEKLTLQDIQDAGDQETIENYSENWWEKGW